MKARVLKRGDLQHTVSVVAKNAKKQKKTVRSIRNTLTLPFQQFWPEAEESDAEQIKTLLEELLPTVKIERVKTLEWRIVKTMSRDERRALREEMHKSIKVPEDSKYLLRGHRDVSRAVEDNQACCCVLSGTVNPRFMMSGILSACQHNNIPVIVLSYLKDVTCSTLGFPATALAFKKCVSESKDNKFYPIYKQVKKLWKKLSPSDFPDVPSENDKESTSGNKVVEDEMDTEDEDSADSLNTKLQAEDSGTKHINRIRNEIEYKINPEPYKYLYLKPDGSRAFIPEKENKTQPKKELFKQMDFISLSDNSNPYRKRRVKEPKEDLVGTDDEPEDKAMNINDLFVIDKSKQDISVPKAGEVQRFPVKPKSKKQKLIRYFPCKIKTVRSNPGKASKQKKKKT